MATWSCAYMNIGKGLQFDGSNTWILYGDDFNPTDQSDYEADHCTVYQATSNFNLSGFQPGHEVGACAWEIRRDGPGNALSQTYWMDFKRNGTITWSRRYNIDWNSITSSQYSWGWGWCYFGIDKDEVRAGDTNYEIEIYPTDGSRGPYSKSFTVSNLSIDSTLHQSGYMRVEGSHLCYTDNTGDEIGRDGYGYKHKIAYDSSYSTSVGSDKKGYLRLDESDLLSIYYVDGNGVRRRTYPSREWYDGNVNVGSSKKGYMRVGVLDAEDGYGHLCFIAPNGSKRRILNGPPIGYS